MRCKYRTEYFDHEKFMVEEYRCPYNAVDNK